VDQRWTTRQALVTESKILGHLEQSKGSFQPLHKEFPEALEAKGLTEGQKEALKSAFLTKDQFTAWQGVAGSGKTFALKELGLESEKKGHKILGFAPSAEAAKVLESEAQIPSKTVASLLKGSGERGIWIVDEAGLLSARDCETLMAKARESQSKVIFVGDTRQLSSVEAGNPFKLMQQNGIETAFLSESRRQKTAVLKKAAEALAKGEMTEGLKVIERSIQEFKREDTRVRHVASEFLALDPGERSKTLILAGTNRERGLITEEIRSGLKKEGSLGAGIMVQSLVPKDLTREEIKAGAKIEVGDVLVFHRKDQGFLKGDQRTVLGRKGNEFDLEGQGKSFELKGQETFTAYRTEEREFSVGDKVRWTRNDRGLRNGEEFWVAKADKDGLRLMNTKGKEIAVNGRVFLDHAYVSTVYASQGKTAERVLVSTDHTFGRESVYVAVTRAKTEVKIYTEDKGRMIGRAEVSQAKVSALEVGVKQRTLRRG
jgi:ATP-dependent exoDNAse (exonuclease V) alpha subunit